MLRTLLCFSVTLMACGDDRQPFPQSCEIGGDPDGRTVTLWLQDDPDLSAPDAFEGCDLWESKCLTCVAAKDEKSAMAKIHASHDACAFDFGSGGYVLAYSVPGGAIVVKLECMRELFPTEEDGRINHRAMLLVLAHELGHEAGMWWHVPSDCTEDSGKSDFEKDLIRMGVCGKALMNPYIDTAMSAITDSDGQAFDLRDTDHTTFPHLTASETPDGCVLTYRPAP